MNELRDLLGVFLIALVLGSALPAWGSHFRGGTMIPSVDESGVLTLQSTTFWRTTAVAGIDEQANPLLVGVGTMFDVGARTLDTSDSRFTKVDQTHAIQLPSSGTYTITASSGNRVSGIINATNSAWQLTSVIAWDGVSATQPITFNFSSVQVEVIRGLDYVGNLGAVAAPGLILTYDQALNIGISSQPPGFTIDPVSGNLFIPAASTTAYLDNPSNLGADYAFSGNIFADDGSQVEFDWLFDAVPFTDVNLAPEVDDGLIVLAVGDVLDFIATGMDPEEGPLSWSLAGFLGTGVNLIPTFDPVSQLFEWDTAGSVAATYAAQFQASDDHDLTDIGSLTIHVLADFDPFGGLTMTDQRNLLMTVPRPSLTTDGVQVVETNDPNNPDFTGTPNTPFAGGSEVDVGIELSAGDGEKFVCFQFLENTGQISEPICESIILEEAVSIAIDIMPGTAPNVIDPDVRAKFPVAIFGSATFDVAAVDVNSLGFGPADAPPFLWAGVSFEDLDSDGFTDLVVYFRIEEIGIVAGDDQACLVGETLDTTAFVACDGIVTPAPPSSVAAPVPEPIQPWLLASGLAGLACLYRLRRRA